MGGARQALLEMAGSPDYAVDANVLREAADEIERLEASVATFPKTADGVPVVPGMTVWLPAGAVYVSGSVAVTSSGVGKYVATDVGLATKLCIRTKIGVIGRIDAYKCYSTREAAEAAMSKEQPCPEPN